MKKTIISILAISIVSIISLVSVIGISSILFSSSALAITYEKTINPTFTINDTLTLSLSSSDLVINDLMPGNASDSNIITINVLSNNPYGYTLNSSVGGTSGNVTYNNRDLNYTGTVPSGSTAPSFTSLDYGSSVSSLNEFGSNQWGYSYLDTTLSGSNNNSTPTWSNYSGLPLYTDETNIATLKESNTVSAISGDNIEFKLGARADNTQGSGEYRNIINFILTANPEPEFCDTHVCMQDLTLASCAVNVGENGNPAGIGDNITVYDKRTSNYVSGDDASYTVRYINGGCWMTQNLRITGTIPAADSNFTGNDFNASEYSLDANDASYANHCDSTNGYNYACAKDSNNTTTGAWYNYYAASAGTIATDNNTSPATEDICPANWHLPSGPNTAANTDLSKLIGNTTSGWQSPTTGTTAFSAVPGGIFENGSLYYTGDGIWWSASSNGASYRYYLSYSKNNNQFRGSIGYSRHVGYYIRCVNNS